MASGTRWKGLTAMIVVFAIEVDRCPILHSFIVGRKAYLSLLHVLQLVPAMDHMEALLMCCFEPLQDPGYLQLVKARIMVCE